MNMIDNPLETPEAKSEIRQLQENLRKPMNLGQRVVHALLGGKDWESPSDRNYKEAQRRLRTGFPNIKI